MMKNLMKTFLILGLLLVSFQGIGQEKNGEVKGVVTDAISGDVMPYTNVVLEGTTIGTITDDRGFYHLQLVSPGNYQIRASFIGYQEAVYPIVVRAGEDCIQDMQIALTSIQGEEVVITALARGQAKAINTQLASRTIKNVVSEAKIRELPDANVAEALARLPGVSVGRSGGEATSIGIRGVSSNTVYVNGMRMEGGLGSVSSSMMESIELSKAFMPDQDADVMGGSVELVMREARDGFHGEFSFRQGYNYFNNSFDWRDGSALLSKRFFGNRLGVMVGFTYDLKNRGRDSYSTSYRLFQEEASQNSYDISPILITSATLSKTENLNTRTGVTIYTDYKASFGKFYYQGFFANLKSENVIFNNVYNRSNVTNYDAHGYVNYASNYMNGVGAELQFGIVKIDFGASLSNSKDDTPDQISVYSLNKGSRTAYNWVTTETTLQEFIDPDSVTHEIENTVLDIIHRTNNKSIMDEYSYRVNIEIPFKISNKIDGYIKFGGKKRDISREYDSNQVRGNFFSVTKLGLVSQPLNERMPELEMDKYVYNSVDYHLGVFASEPYTQDFDLLDTRMYFLPDFNLIRQAADAVNDILFEWRGQNYNDYTNEEHFLAGYVMTGINLGPFITLTPGVRYEHQEHTTHAKRLWMKSFATDDPNEQGIISDTTAGSMVDNWLPMIHLKIKPVDWADIRLAYTHTLTRPSFFLMSPKVYEDYASIGNPNVFRGNADLRPQANTNYDVSLSLYGKKIGLFTTSFFYKTIEDQVFNYSKDAVDASQFGLPLSPPNIAFSTPINNPYRGYIMGLEFDWQNHFSYLPKPFNGIIVNANLALMRSESKYPFYYRSNVDLLPDATGGLTSVVEGIDTYRVTKVIGQPDMTCNVGIGYEIGGFSGRISYYYQGFTLTSQQDLANISMDVNIEPFSRVDLQLSQRFKKVRGLVVYLNIMNLTNVHDKSVYTYYPHLVKSDEVYGAAGDIGVRYKF